MSYELDEQMAIHVMGWRLVHVPVSMMQPRAAQTVWYNGASPAYITYTPQVSVLPGTLPAFSRNHAHCAIAEAEIVRRGLGEAYAKALEMKSPGYVMEGGAGNEHVDWETVIWLITASPDVRCQAMLAALKEV